MERILKSVAFHSRNCTTRNPALDGSTATCFIFSAALTVSLECVLSAYKDKRQRSWNDHVMKVPQRFPRVEKLEISRGRVRQRPGDIGGVRFQSMGGLKNS